ncbi:MAG TPA: ABC transporter ATP-binding protein [Terriglobia bacterium]|nr:ABC transporter ATP-binding protein [Terriglobia bacterium]
MIQSSSELAVETRGLRKVFGQKVAVEGLTLEVRRGEVFGFLGPNGAGKSTSVKMLLGLVAPTRGEARVLGRPLSDVAARRRIGFLPEHFRFYDWLTAEELLHVHGRLCGLSRSSLQARIPGLLDLVGLGEHRRKRLREFSKGMLQRIGLAQALVNDPDLIILDEPTSGLDPAGRRLVRDIIKTQRERGAAVLLNSHLLGEVEVTCDRVAFIKHGRVLETRRLDYLDAEQTRVRLRAGKLTSEALAGLGRWASEVHTNADHLTLTLASPEALPEVARYLVGSGADLYELTPEKKSLEDLFLEIVGSEGGL